MNSEQIESELSSINGSVVNIVRPGYGTQSDSWVGDLSVMNDSGHIRFHVSSGNHSFLFEAGDIAKLESPRGEHTKKIIRLKGPSFYAKIQTSR